MKKINKAGFTIIEVVLVLAIAGLIFLIVFMALPQLQKSRRDAQRKSDISKILGYLEKYASNNSGQYPTTLSQASFVNTYITTDGTLADPSSGAYTMPNTAQTNPNWAGGGKGGGSPAAPGTIAYSTSAYCDGDHSVSDAGNAGKIAIMIKLESGQYCEDNS